MNSMAQTLVVACSRCGGLLLAKADQKTRECPHCGCKILLQNSKKLASVNTANEASAILKKMKSEAATQERRLHSS